MDIYCLMALSWRLGTQFDIFMTFNSGFKQLHFQNFVCFYLAHVVDENTTFLIFLLQRFQAFDVLIG